MEKSKLQSRKNFDHPYTLRNSAEWIQSGTTYFDRLAQLIRASAFEIHLQTYIFEPDETGKKIAMLLKEAALRNVKVHVLVDAYGSQKMGNDIIDSLIEAGVRFRKYGELYSHGRFHIGRRMHHKVCVFDGLTSIVGGINISDRYNDIAGNKAWLDFAVIMEGDISRGLLVICRKRWYGWRFSKKLPEILERKLISEDSVYKVPIRIRRNDFIRNKNDIAISYRETFRHAKKSILLVGGYFLPGGRTRRLMKLAISRGVKIDILVAEKSDVPVNVYARRYLYAWLIRNKINVFEYTPSNVHGKVLIADGKWASVGSFDLNNLSTYSNIELNVDIDDAEFATNIGDHIRQIISEDCIQVTEQNNFKVSAKFFMWVSYHFVKTLFVLSVLLAGKREKEF